MTVRDKAASKSLPEFTVPTSWNIPVVRSSMKNLSGSAKNYQDADSGCALHGKLPGDKVAHAPCG